MKGSLGVLRNIKWVNSQGFKKEGFLGRNSGEKGAWKEQNSKIKMKRTGRVKAFAECSLA